MSVNGRIGGHVCGTGSSSHAVRTDWIPRGCADAQISARARPRQHRVASGSGGHAITICGRSWTQTDAPDRPRSARPQTSQTPHAAGAAADRPRASYYAEARMTTLDAHTKHNSARWAHPACWTLADDTLASDAFEDYPLAVDDAHATFTNANRVIRRAGCVIPDADLRLSIARGNGSRISRSCAPAPSSTRRTRVQIHRPESISDPRWPRRLPHRYRAHYIQMPTTSRIRPRPRQARGRECAQYSTFTLSSMNAAGWTATKSVRCCSTARRATTLSPRVCTHTQKLRRDLSGSTPTRSWTASSANTIWITTAR